MFFLIAISVLVLTFSIEAHSISSQTVSALGLNTFFVAQLAFLLALLFLGTVLIGLLLERMFKLPAIASQILAGIILGPSLLHIAGYSMFASLVQIGNNSFVIRDFMIFFINILGSLITVPLLLWMAGHETDIKQLKKVGFIAISAGILGALLPIGLISFLMLVLGNTAVQSVAMGLIFSATSVSIPVAMLIAYNKMQTREAQVTLGAAVVDDIVAVILLSLFFIFNETGTHSTSLTGSLFSIGACFMVFIGIGLLVLPRLFALMRRYSNETSVISLSFPIMWLYFTLAEMIGGLAGITGAYFAGLFHQKNEETHTTYKIIAPFVQKFLLPLFLCSIGLTIDITALSLSHWVYVLVLLIVAIVTKITACFIATSLNNLTSGAYKWNTVESFIFGASMIARGEVGLVMATIMRSSGLLNEEWYIIAVVVLVLTTIATPILLSQGFKWASSNQKNADFIEKIPYGATKIETEQTQEPIANNRQKNNENSLI